MRRSMRRIDLKCPECGRGLVMTVDESWSNIECDDVTGGCGYGVGLRHDLDQMVADGADLDAAGRVEYGIMQGMITADAIAKDRLTDAGIQAMVSDPVAALRSTLYAWKGLGAPEPARMH